MEKIEGESHFLRSWWNIEEGLLMQLYSRECMVVESYHVKNHCSESSNMFGVSQISPLKFIFRL